MPSGILVYEVMEQHCVFKAGKLEVKVVLKERHIELSVVKDYCFLVKKLLKKTLSFATKTISINISAALIVIRKTDTEHITVARVKTSCLRVESNVVAVFCNSCTNKFICFLRVLNTKRDTVVYDSILLTIVNVLKYTLLSLLPHFLRFWLECKHSRIDNW